MTDKDFKSWLKIKINIENKKNFPFFHEREIWWCSLGSNIGIEEDGKNDSFERPVLIFRKFNKEMFWGLSLTSKYKDGIFYYSFWLHEKKRTVILSQIRTLSSKRLIRRLGKIGEKEFKAIEKHVVALIKTNPLRGSQVPNGNL